MCFFHAFRFMSPVSHLWSICGVLLYHVPHLALPCHLLTIPSHLYPVARSQAFIAVARSLAIVFCLCTFIPSGLAMHGFASDSKLWFCPVFRDYNRDGTDL